MPQETFNNPVVVSPTTEKSRSAKLFIIIFVIFLFLIGIFLTYLFFKSKNSPKSTTVTNLEVEQINLGWTSLSGVYPKNSNPPKFDDNNFNDSIFEALTKVRGSSVVPSLATKWTNPSNLIWRFDIRKNVKFQSGDLLTAQDVKYSFDQVLGNAKDENKAWPSTNSVSTIKKVTVIDAYTVEIETSAADPILLNRITDVYIISKSQIERDGLDKAVGTGPFKVVSFEKAVKAIVVRNDQYWGTKPKVKQAIFRVFDTSEKLVTEINKGGIDYARLESSKVVVPTIFEKQLLSEPRVVMIFFNFAAKKLNGKDNPLLNKKVRQAIKLSIDQTKLLRDADVNGTIANQFLTRSIVGYNSEISRLTANTLKASSLLSEEKVANLSFDLHATSDRLNVANQIAKQLDVVGIKVTVVKEENFGDLVGKLFAGKATAFIASPSANDGGEYIDGVFKTEADSNILSYTNPTVDKNIKEANSSFSPRQRKDILEKLSQTIIDEVPVIPLYSINNTFVIKKTLSFETNYLTDFILESVSGKETK